MTYLIEDELRESSSVISAINPQQIEAISAAMIAAIKKGNKVIFFGNGGSASDAVHIAAEFSGRYLMERPAMDGIALSSLSSITGIGNDYGYDRVFVRQLEACMKEGDVAVGISTSGNSKNVVLALEFAKTKGVTVSFTGSGGIIKDLVDYPLVIPSTHTPRIQEAYLCAGHIICGLVEKGVFGQKAVFIDRDNTIAPDVPYCADPRDFNLYPGVGEALKKLNDASYITVLVTNQSGIGRGYFTESVLAAIHHKMNTELSKDGAFFNSIHFCPHTPEDKCSCRKPQTGMYMQAVREHNINLRESWVIGDSDADIDAGKTLGCRTIRINSEMTFVKAVEQILNNR